jgi:hypothetical protein
MWLEFSFTLANDKLFSHQVLNVIPNANESEQFILYKRLLAQADVNKSQFSLMPI